MLWFHGGGQVLGFAAQEDAYLKRIAGEVGCMVVSVDYRLAPEARAPAAAQDGLADLALALRRGKSAGRGPGAARHRGGQQRRRCCRGDRLS